MQSEDVPPMASWTVWELLDRTARAEPTPSAVSVAAVSAALALGLVAMGFDIAAGRRGGGRSLPGQERAEDLMALGRLAREGAQALLRDAQDDQEAVRGYIRARRKEGPEAARQALVRATEVPIASARRMREGLRLAEHAASVTPPPVGADVRAGVALLRGALAAVLGCAESNLSHMPETESRRAALAQAARELADDEQAPGSNTDSGSTLGRSGD